MPLLDLINPINRDQLRDQVRNSKPVRNFAIDNFLKPDFAEEVFKSFPSFEEALREGRTFHAVNERGKVQLTDASKFPEPVARLNQLLASAEFREIMSYAMEIPNLLADDQLIGGGIHQTNARGHLDVHVDFNYLEDRQLHRRMNIIVFFNKNWQPEWGGNFELWDADVKVCHHSHAPIFNRCIAFETNEVSFHGVKPVACPPDQARKSFAAYYYTTEAPAHWTGESHSTIFRARPNEVLKGTVAMPAEKASRWLKDTLRKVKKKAIG